MSAHSDSEGDIIARIPKGRDEIIVQLRTYKGERALDIRVHFTTNDGELRATQKGLWLPRETAEQLMDVLATHREPIMEALDK